ncbi:MAG: FdtA/QdtA family cupin domain-containing protein [Bacteroidetes bacterium]|nr:FdtA/QdtA family cupin domain-containing protein [Bacteroidota bacterium]
MANLLTLRTFSDTRGNLSVLEDHEIPFPIKRLFYIYGVDESKRGGHRHKTTHQALICLTGSCRVRVNNGQEGQHYHLNTPKNCLILEPKDWHDLYDFAPNTILLSCASEYFNQDDYIFEEYNQAR